MIKDIENEIVPNLSIPKRGLLSRVPLLEIVISYFDQITQTLEKANIAVEGLFVNEDAGFDSWKFIIHFENKCIMLNIVFSKSNEQIPKIIILMKFYIRKGML